MAERVPVPRPSPRDWKRFMDKVEVIPLSGCWEWKGAKFKQGYGMFWLDGKQRRAHRILYVWLYGEVERGTDLDHVCRNRACVNPEHLEAATRRENVLRGNGPSAQNAAKTHCVNGHEFTPENTYRDVGGWRQCRECARQKTRRYRDANREEVNARRREKNRAKIKKACDDLTHKLLLWTQETKALTAGSGETEAGIIRDSLVIDRPFPDEVAAVSEKKASM